MNDRQLLARNARMAIETMQRVDNRFQTTVLNGLVASFQRIEDNPGWIPEKALDDHLYAMAQVAMSPSDLMLIQVDKPFLFKNCESLMRWLARTEINGNTAKYPSTLHS